jgi:hypothetical protein
VSSAGGASAGTGSACGSFVTAVDLLERRLTDASAA